MNQDNAGLVPDQHLDPVRALGSEDEGRAAERIEAERLLDGQRQPVNAFAVMQCSA